MIFDTLAYTGLRREEVTKILRSDVSLERITVQDGK
jgi:integrase